MQKDRLSVIQNILTQDEAVIITSDANRFYLTGYQSDTGSLVITKNHAKFFIDFRYIEKAKKAISVCETELTVKLYSQIKEMLFKQNVKTVYLEANHTSVNELRAYKSCLGEFDVCDSDRFDVLLNQMRAVKSKEEQESIILAQKLTDDTFNYIIDRIKVGKTEKEIMLDMEFHLRRLGSEGVSFDFIVVSGKNSSLPHGVPTDKKIQKGDFVTMDFGAVVNGYHSDMTRTVAVGFATDEMKTVYNTVLSAQETALGEIRAGAVCSDIDRAARDIIENAGFKNCFGHALGHSLGIEIHEFPTLSPKCLSKLKTGNAVTVEPGIYIEDKFGVRIEDTVFVTDNGCFDITKSKKELIII